MIFILALMSYMCPLSAKFVLLSYIESKGALLAHITLEEKQMKVPVILLFTCWDCDGNFGKVMQNRHLDLWQKFISILATYYCFLLLMFSTVFHVGCFSVCMFGSATHYRKAAVSLCELFCAFKSVLTPKTLCSFWQRFYQFLTIFQFFSWTERKDLAQS